MGAPIIEARGLGKRYRIGAGPERGEGLRHAMTRWLTRPGSLLTSSTTEFWALRDVSFDVNEGEVLGIVGANGAGKSTLLKVLSRITVPTEGEALLRGRVASLLEVGTGFHPELTGRENIFMNGSILGMSRTEIAAKFDEIVAFAEVEAFLDTPVKRYSSGMYVRLAFAVAAHLEPEILLIDEVLAVGDVGFQRKCLGKMKDVARSGRTVLFVSHNMGAVKKLCDRGIWIDGGRIIETGTATEVTQSYLNRFAAAEEGDSLAAQISRLPADPTFRLLRVGIEHDDEETSVVFNGEGCSLVFEYEIKEEVQGLRVYFDLCDEDGDILVRSFHDENDEVAAVARKGRYRSTARIPANLLSPREYLLFVRVGIHNVRDIYSDGLAVPLTVERTSLINRAYPNDPVRSKLQPFIRWQTEIF